jgi:23S rRNA (uracil1939-C5)-methyltransferase
LAGTVVAGYRELGAPDRVIDVPDCPLAEPAVREVWHDLRRMWGQEAAALPAGGELRLTLRGSVAGDVDLLVEGGEAGSRERLGHLVASVGGLVGCCHVHDDESIPVGTAGLRDTWQGLEYDLPPGVFLQVNREVSARMDQWLDERVGSLAGRSVLDLYAGVGARAVRWAALGARVVACEISRAACEAGRSVARHAGSAVTFVEGRVEDSISDLLPVDVVVVNPPRAGLPRSVTSELVSRGASALAYVSCDSATLARDLVRLSDGWQVEEVQPFDAFPQTAHVETIAWMTRR